MQQVTPAVRRFVSNLQVLCLALFLLISFHAQGQVAGTASIQGTVTDASGAVIANAPVTLTEKATQVVHNVKTDNSGVYIFPNIDIGDYSVTVAAPGFETYTNSGIVLEVGSSISVNVTMKVGSATDRVEVKTDSLALQTEDPSFKQTIDGQDITELPLNSNSRQITGLLQYSGGSTPAPSGDFTGSKYSYQTISVSIAGGSGNTTLWRLDGGDNNDYMGNGNLPFPFPDAVAQFSVESTALGAQDGMHSGGLVNVVTRSGTNSYHGSAFEFIRNNYLDATNFFATCTPVAPATTCSPKDQLHQNQYGGTFGGKIKRDKLFAFAGYQHLESKQLSASTKATVPTAANLLGDFSVTDGPLCTSTGKVIPLVDPLTGVPLVGDKYATPPTYNAAALALQKLLPVPNALVDPNNCGFVSYAIPQDIYDNEFVTRVDWTINASNNLYGRYFIDGYQAPAFFSPTNILITTATGNIERTQSFTLGENYAISSKFVNSAHVTILRRSNNRGYAPNDINAASLGISPANLFQAEPNGLQITEGKFTVGGGTNSVSHFNDNTLAFDDEVTLVRGKHQFVFGGEFVRNQLNISNAYESNGTFTFNGSYSGSGPAGGTVIGDQNLDFLQGALQAFQQSKFQQNALRAPVPSLYAQDTFHPTKQLTLIAGIRWSPEYMPVDTKNRGTVFNYNAFLANQVSSIYPNAPAGTFFYGDTGVPRAFTRNSPYQFSPNVGVAFDPTGSGRTVIRAGAELIYDEVNFFTGQRTQQNPPFATAVSPNTSGQLSFSSPWTISGVNTNPFPQPVVPTPATAQFFPQSQYIVLPSQFKPAYTMQWTASIQHDFSHGWQLQVDYIGNKTTHDPLATPLSPAVFVPGVWGANASGCPGVVQTGPGSVLLGKASTYAAGSPCSQTGNQNSRFALTVANPAQGNQYLGGGGGSILVNDEGTANYNGLVSTVQHRLSSSFSLLVNHTWSKCLNEEDAQGDYASVLVENPNNPRLDYGPCGSDYRNVENVVLIAKSNFALHGIGSLLVNGWEITPGAHILSGAPFTVTSGQDNSYTDVGQDRPNLVPGVPVYVQIANRSATGEAAREYLNPAAFAQVTAGCPTPISPATCAAYGSYGNIGRNSFRGLPNYQFDGQVSRIFPIHESLALTLRLEGFNLLNHPNFNLPTGGTTGTIGGQTGSAAVLTSSTFGQISSTTNTARVFQGSLKLNF
jgi:hypothetical protein